MEFCAGFPNNFLTHTHTHTHKKNTIQKKNNKKAAFTTITMHV